MSYQQFVKQMSEHFKLFLIGVNSDELFTEQFEYAIASLVLKYTN